MMEAAIEGLEEGTASRTKETALYCGNTINNHFGRAMMQEENWY